MCAIAGEIDYRKNLKLCGEGVCRRMLETMRRRGPDQYGIYRTDHAVLLHARLSVIDPERGRQPMTAARSGETYTLVYNGELYNTEEIRWELLREGWDFESHSDTEVLLKAYAAWGADCLRKLNGIYAFAIWEEQARRLFLARDRMGVKPLFYTEADGTFLFASEIKTLLAHPAAAPVADLNAIAELMLIGPGRTPGCGVFRGIHEIKPGWLAYVTAEGMRTEAYWTLQDREHTESFEETAAHVRSLVVDAIQRQLVSDVPIGTFLSGGLDSSLISSVAARYFAERGRTLDTFSVYYQDNEKYFTASKFQPNSDEHYIDRMTAYLQCRHERLTIGTEELVQALFEAVTARDLPGMADVDSSLLLFCREIKKHCTVALSGECADEIFGGYPWYRDPTIREAEGFPWAQSTAWRAGFLHEELAGKIDAAAYVDARYRQTAERTPLHGKNSPEDRNIKIMTHLNMQWFMQTLLDRKDRMSMYSGLEVRVPFCDSRIAEYLYGVPWQFKDHNGVEKGLLREAAAGLLPDEVLWRKKSPYPKTHHPAYLSRVSELLTDVLHTPNAPLLELVKKEKLRELLQSSRQIPWYGQLMTVPQTIAYFLQLNDWLERYHVQICV